MLPVFYITPVYFYPIPREEGIFKIREPLKTEVFRGSLNNYGINNMGVKYLLEIILYNNSTIK
jgi:hypothetical protein